MEAETPVAQAVRSKVLSLGDFVARRKQSTRQTKKDYMGYVYSLPDHEQEALVEAGRLSVKELRAIDNAEHAALDEYHKVRVRAMPRARTSRLRDALCLASMLLGTPKSKRTRRVGCPFYTVRPGTELLQALAGERGLDE